MTVDFAKLLLAFVALAFVVLGIQSCSEAAWRHAHMLRQLGG